MPRQPHSEQLQKAASASPNPPDPRKATFPKPYAQGDLDTLCGAYAIINGCQVACNCLDPAIRIQGKLLFQAMMSALADHGTLSAAMSRALDHHWEAKLAFTLLDQYLQKQGTAAVLNFTSLSHRHWTAIREIRGEKLILSDSAWFRPLPIRHIALAPTSLWLTKYSFSKEDLLFLAVSPTGEP